MQSVSAQRRSSGGALATAERKEQAVRSTVAFSFLHAKVWTKKNLPGQFEVEKVPPQEGADGYDLNEADPQNCCSLYR